MCIYMCKCVCVLMQDRSLRPSLFSLRRRKENTFRQYQRKTNSGIGQSKVKLKLRVDIKTQLGLVLRKLTFKVQGLCSNNHHPFNPNAKARGGNDVRNLTQSRHLAARSKASVVARASCSIDI